jgi:outer membrane immunogenic protein
MNTIRNKFIKALPFAAALGAAAMFAIPANAADVLESAPQPPAAAPVVAPANGWAGAYAGVQGGGNISGQSKTRGVHANTSGGTVRGFGGFNMQNGQFVYGVEGDVGYDGSTGSHAGFHTRGGVDGSLRGRVGYAPTDRILVYGTAGAATKSMRVTTPVSSDRNAMWGWTAGAGIDAKITDKVFARVEYRYTDYGRQKFNVGGVRQNVSDNSNTIEAGIGVKF